MNVRHLRYLIEITRAGSLRLAADSLYVTQSALSRAIAELEKDLDCTLFERRARGVVPTPQCIVLLNRARMVLSEVDAIRADVHAADTDLSGRVILAASGSARDRLTRPLVKYLRERHPRILLEIIEETARGTHDAVAQGTADLSLTTTMERGATLHMRTLFTDPLCLLGSADSGLKMRRSVGLPMLTEVPLILAPPPNTVRSVVESALRKQRRKVAPILEVQSAQIMIDLVQDGHGFAILPEGAVRQPIRDGRITAAPLGNLSLTWAVAWSKERMPSNCVRTVAEAIVTCAR